MRYLVNLFIFTICLSFLLPSCDPEFLIDQETCFFLGSCAEGEQLTWHIGTATCWCYCEYNNPGNQSCGKRCQFKQNDCQGEVVINDFDGLNQCSCKCPDGWKNPPNCDIIIGTWAADWFDMWADPSFPFRLDGNQDTDPKDYFPLNEGHIWKYAAYDSAGQEVVSSFAYSIVDTFQLDTLDTIRIYDFNYYFFDSSDQVFDTLIGMMVYNNPEDSNEIYNYSNNDEPFMFHHFNYGDTIYSEDEYYTVVDSIGEVTVHAGTFQECVWLRNQDSSGQVLAPDVGMIQMIAENLSVIELSNYFLHCPFHVEIDTFGVSDCNTSDGQIDLMTFGDTTNMNYQWDGPTPVGNVKTASNLSAGYYTVTVTNGDCTNVFDSIPVGGCSALPVELLDFSAQTFNQHVLLEWETSTEINSDYFQIEHSVDGRKFYSVERIQAAGNSYQRSQYSYLHTKAVKGVNFYRLKQVDKGGLFEYSEVVSVSLDQQDFSFYPNPARDYVTIVSDGEQIQVQILGMDGHIFRSQQIKPGSRMELNGLTPGMYLLRVGSGLDARVRPFILSGS